MWDKEHEKRNQEWFKTAWDYGWPITSSYYDKLIQYILREARCEKIKKEFEEVLKPNPKKSDYPTPYGIELAMRRAITIAVAFGYAFGELFEVTNKEPFEYLKKVIQDKHLLAYLPRDRKSEATLTK